HFSVLNGINGETVLLADPSLGHVSTSKSQFLSAWKTRDGEMDGINGETVLLADPSLGHVSTSKSQFLSAWKTRDGEMEGKILA
ncbi:cysteine peptidase family C39 domain-containing protein, partial [Neisseria gonorrhoeae]